MPRKDRNLARALWAALGTCALACAPADEAPARSAPPAPPSAPRLAPFEDLPGKASAKQTQGGAQTPFSGEPEDSPIWQRAVALAAQAEGLFVEAQEAQRAGNRTALNERGREARVLFDRALEDTAVFEEEMLAAHGEHAPVVARIVSARSAWFDRTRWLHKSISR